MEQLRARAGVALTFVKAYHPNADIDAIAEGVPADPQGNAVDVEALVPAVSDAAAQIIGFLDLGAQTE